MKIPQIPTVQTISQLTPSLYEAALHCKARAIWSAFGDRNSIPQNPNAILGTCFHKVLELANKGQFSQEKEACRDAARQAFEIQAKSQYQNAHPLLKSKFSSVDRLPYYYLLRERSASHAINVALQKKPSTSRETLKLSGGSEVPLVSRDGLIKGRPDYINVAQSEVIDYKSGFKAEATEIELSESEVRQLRLYAYLSLENDIQISKGTIIRADNQLATETISDEDAQKEGAAARVLLAELNAAASIQTFQEMAQPSPDNCKNCSCISLCEAFWEQATPEWENECGTHLEAKVIQSPSLSTDSDYDVITIEADVIRGTCSPTQITIQQIPKNWLVLDGENIPELGDVIRLVDGQPTDCDSSSVVRIDKFATTIWTV
jgi:CRISPR/Cas system-associated exonuclease Cas4 (RecB family)